MISSSVTYISSFFSQNKDEEILEIPCPMIIFTDQPSLLFLKEKRGKYPTTFLLMKLEELPYSKYADIFRYCRINNPIFNSDPKRDTIESTIFRLSLQYFILRSVELNPYTSTHFAWVDIRMRSNEIEWNKINQEIVKRDRISLCCKRITSHRELEDRVLFYAWFRERIYTGLITGPAGKLKEVSELFVTEFLRCLRDGIAPTEEQIFTWIVTKNPQLFNLYYGEYAEILTKYI